MKERSDIELLDDYTSQHSDEAFRELVSRHVDFIYSAALRQLRNPHLAQEATQSAFFALAKNAGKLRRQTVVVGWLYRAVQFAALNLQRSEMRRKHWEEEAAAVNAQSEQDPFFQQHVLEHLDGALAELSETDRDAVILRFLQQQSFRDVAEALDISEEAAKKRVSRALEKLRGLLSRRGVTISVSALAVGLSQVPVIAAPATLQASASTLAIQAAEAALGSTPSLSGVLSSFKAKLALTTGIVVLGGIAAAFLPRSENNNPIVSARNTNSASMKIHITSVAVDDQEKALQFYTGVLGLMKKFDVPTGGARWLTVVSPDEPGGTELLLEPMGFPPSRTYQKALFDAGMPFAALLAGDVQKEYDRLSKLGVNFSTKPTQQGAITIAVFEDTCGNRIQLFQPPKDSNTNAAVVSGIRISLARVMVNDQAKALKFYTERLGFLKKTDIPAEEGRWVTVVSPENPAGTQLLLEPVGFAPARVYQKALYDAGIPQTAFGVSDIDQEYNKLRNLGVVFKTKPTQMGPVSIAVFDDTCGNLIQMVQQ